MSDHAARAEAFRRLHGRPEPLRLVNAWDGLSARVFAMAGAPAIGTSSFAVAASLGYQDGQHVPWPAVRRVAGEIVEAAGDVPVTVDIEAGGGAEPADVARTVADVVAAGAVGVNLEDGNPEAPGTLFDVDDQCRRLSAARSAADERGVPLYVNARCDTYFSPAVEPARRLDETLKRAAAYLTAGADGIFLPGLVDTETLRTVVAAVDAPVNVMVWPGLPPADELAGLGVKRISQGGAMFLLDVGFLERSARAFLEGPWEHTGGDVAPAVHLVGELVHRT
jgi:2-methylisocitrate lyase-like PEP mutase family enzyme